ncbi:unnamed protein product [Auanema sp. JU1783]|nr:unnamed protein product [Auanema sp. JU1783]
MDIASQVEVENELRTYGLERLRNEKTEINKQLKQLQDKIGDLAFDNYRTYVDAGKTAEDCTDIFTEISEKLREVSTDVPLLQNEIKEFYTRSKSNDDELRLIKSASDRNSPLWEILSLPSRMDLCIRSGYYDAAYSLTNYGMLMHQHSMVSNPLLKRVADRLVDARSLLLEELFNKFSGPLDLATSLQVVNNVRKMPYLTPTQLRVSILHHKDLYLEKQLIDIATHPDYALMAIDVYRTCMHDTLVLYLSVFPENEAVRKDPSIDPRWEAWPTSAPSAILGQWANRNIQRLLDLVHRADMKSGVDMASIWTKMMSVASTFGRLGLDFRPLIIQSLSGLVLDRFRALVKKATARLTNEVTSLVVISGDIGPLPPQETQDAVPIPAPEISLWDDLCVYGNDLLNALNGMRYSHSPLLVSSVVTILKDSLKLVLSWLADLQESPNFPKAKKIFCLSFLPFLSQTIQYMFPYSVVSRMFGSTLSLKQYNLFTEFSVKELAAEIVVFDDCDIIENRQVTVELVDIKVNEQVTMERTEAPTIRVNEEQNVTAAELHENGTAEEHGVKHENEKNLIMEDSEREFPENEKINEIVPDASAEFSNDWD